MAKRRTGIDPLAYMGVEPSTPAQFVVENRNPTTNDYDGFNLQTVWLNKSTRGVWMLVDKSDFIATWFQFTSSSSALNTLTGDTGGAVPPLAGNINIVGSGAYTVSGNVGTNTLTISDDGSIVTSYDTDSGTATPSANVLNIVGGTGVTVTGAGNTVTINSNPNNLQIVTDAGVNVSPTGSILEVHGDKDITTTGIAPNIISVSVTGATTDGIQIGDSDGSLTSLAPLTTGQLLIGVTGSVPNSARLTAGSNVTIDDTSIPGQITISATGGGGGGGTSGCSIVTAQTANVLNDINNISYYCTDAPFGISVSSFANQSAVTESGQFSDLFVYVSQNASTTDNTVTFYVNSIATSITITIPAGATGVFSDTTHTASVNQGDLIQFQASQATTGNTTGVITITFTCAGSSGVGSTIVTTFNASGTFTKNSASKLINYYFVSAGAGGGSGGKGLTYASGGGGGAPRGVTCYSIPAMFVGASQTVTIGAGGAGGAAQTLPNTAGRNGAEPGLTIVGTANEVPAGDGFNHPAPYFAGRGGPVGLSTGSASAGTGGYCIFYSSGTITTLSNPGRYFPGGAGFTSQVGQTPSTAGYFPGITGGGGGGGYSSGTLSAGGNGGATEVPIGSGYQFGTPGVGGATSSNGTNGSDILTDSLWLTAGLGGGGGGGGSLTGGNGGNGGFPGGGGGGGGGVGPSAVQSGAGGNGGNGAVYIIEFL